MSKKKALNTMTLKDFHGGSIPSDLPLPSAPGVVVRQPDRAGYDRPQWGRSDNRSRPNSASATRNLDDRTLFLGSSVHIGRNFDEDERKPLDGVSGPRRIVSAESVRGVPNRGEVKLGSLYSVPSVGGGVTVNSYSGRIVGGGPENVGTQSMGVSGGQGGLGRGSTNAWTARKEAAMCVSQPGQSAWSVQSAATKLAHASALEKVSSGLWQTKPSVKYPADIEVISHDDAGMHYSVIDDVVPDRLGFVDERKYYDEILASRTERSLNIEDGIRGGGKGLLDHGRAGVVEVREGKQSVYNEGVKSAQAHGKYSASEMNGPVPSEPLERPKLKLLPRTKPLENVELLVVDHKQGYQHLGDRAAKSGNELHRNLNSAKVGTAGVESGNHEAERRKLNLQPRSPSLENSEQIEKERKALFGGARPREVVLKERGIDSIVSNHEIDHPADRVKHDAPKTGRIPGNAISSRPNDKIENLPSDQRPVKKLERKDHRLDAEKTDMQKRSWRKENWRNNKEIEKQKQQQQPQERPPSPETWRKPVEEARPASEAGGTRIRKATSALELAQAFSRSVSDSKMGDRNSGQRGLPGRTQVPFSRLTGPMPRKQINGY